MLFILLNFYLEFLFFNKSLKYKITLSKFSLKILKSPNNKKTININIKI